MAEIQQNLLSNARLKGYGGAILRKEEVKSYLDGQIKELTDYSQKGGNAEALLRAKKSELETMQKNFAEREKNVYRALGGEGVETIEQFQEMLDTKLKDLERLSNKALRTMPLVQDIKGDKITVAEINSRLQKVIDDELVPQIRGNSKQHWKTTRQKVGQAIVDEIFGEQNKNGATLSEADDFKKFLMKNLIETTLPNKKRKITLNPSTRDTLRTKYRQKLIGYLEFDDITISGTGLEAEAKFDLVAPPDDLKERTLSYYPYYKLTAEEKVKAETNGEIWNDFKNQLCYLIDNAGLKATARKVLDNGLMTPKDFFVSSYGELVGVLGEFQALVLFGSIEVVGSKDGFLKYTGNYLTQKEHQKIDIDILLGNAGVQVKNYAMYGNDAGAWLRKGNIQLKTLLSRIAEAAPNDNFIQTMADYYTMRAYHVNGGQDADFKEPLGKMKTADNRIKNLWQGYINNYLALNVYNEVALNASDNAPTVDLGGAQNLFYMIGGKKIVPISKIIGAYIKYINTLLADPGQNRRALVVDRAYSKDGDTYANFYKLWHKFNPTPEEVQKKIDYLHKFSGGQGYKNVYDGIYMVSKVNLNMNYILKEIQKDLKN